MTDSARTRANAEQRRAADPTASAFVAASAGSGKTKLLTDRLLRLMLAEPPEAAAAHPVPHLHQGRRRRNGGPAATHPRRVGHPATTPP